MLYPQENVCRERKELSGFWDYRFDWDREGRKDKWYTGFAPEGDMPVPASWNELFTDDAHKHFFGTCWYQRTAVIPQAWQGKKIWIRVGAVNYRATVWINGKRAGSHEGCHLPFQFDISKKVLYGQENLIIIAVNATLDKNTIPPGNLNVGGTIAGAAPVRSQPDVTFDFFPYGGIHRPVELFTTDVNYIEDVTVVTDIEETTGIVRCDVDVVGKHANRIVVGIGNVQQDIALTASRAHVALSIPEALLWAPGNPHLYQLNIELFQDEELLDTYRLSVGIRTVTWDENSLYINGKPVFLKGFGKHEDFPIVGKGLNHAVIKRDFELLNWIHANSFRTTHYPYAEEVLDMADREGFLIISETAAVGIGTGTFHEKLQKNHMQAMVELMNRDKNHPSVIMWSISNEPSSQLKESLAYFKPLMATARALDNTRPFTIVTCDGPWVGRKKCNIMQLCDILCLNRYYGWYVSQGRIDEAMDNFSEELDALHAEHKKPIMLTEYGGDAVAGLHSLPGSVWTEEYQSDLIERSMEVMHSKPYMAGDQIWNFADFMTAQTHTRVVGNRKGVFTRDRQPKLAAHTVRRIWGNLKK